GRSWNGPGGWLTGTAYAVTAAHHYNRSDRPRLFPCGGSGREFDGRRAGAGEVPVAVGAVDAADGRPVFRLGFTARVDRLGTRIRVGPFPGEDACGVGCVDERVVVRGPLPRGDPV